MQIDKEELDHIIENTRKEASNGKLAGKRKLYFCSIASFAVYGMTFAIILKYGKDTVDIIQWPYVAICAILIGLYPVVNAVSKFAAKIAGDKLTKLVDSISKLVKYFRKDVGDEEEE